jgi:hypothetical protein
LFSVKSFEIAGKLSNTREISHGWLSKVAGALLLAFQKRIVHRKEFWRV